MVSRRGQVLYGVRSSDPPRPRAMPRRAAMAWGSVGRGVHRRSMELRNHRSGVPTLYYDGEGKNANISVKELRSGSRRNEVSVVRAGIAIGLVKEHGVALAEVARRVGVTTSAISKIIKRGNSWSS